MKQTRMMKYVAYYRVSTKAQGASGLGLEAQNTCVECRIDSIGGELVGEFTDIESGKRDDRPQLKAALEVCKREGATLIIAKLDRLSRSASFIMALRDSGVKIEACDLPDFNTLTLGIFASFAQYERDKIAERTKAALAAKKEKVGKWKRGDNLTDAARSKAWEANKRKARVNVNNRKAAALLVHLNVPGNSLRMIAESLNDAGFTTSTGKQFTAMQVKRLIDRMNNDKAVREDAVRAYKGAFDRVSARRGGDR